MAIAITIGNQQDGAVCTALGQNGLGCNLAIVIDPTGIL